MTDQDEFNVDVTEFVENNSNLFLVLGVFSALAIYISQLQDVPLTEAPLETRVGFAGSLLLAVLIISLIYKKLIEDIGSLQNIIRAHTRITANLDLILFTTGIILLIPALASPLLEYQNALYFTLGAMSIVFSVPLIFEMMLIIEKYLPDSGILRQTIIVMLSIVSVGISNNVFEYISSGSFPVGTIEFSITNPQPLVFDIIATIFLVIFSIGILAFYKALFQLAYMIVSKYK